MRRRLLSSATAIALTLAACSSNGPTNTDTAPLPPAPPVSTSPAATAPPSTAAVAATGSDQCPTDGEPLDTALLYIEHNATDADTGVHGLFGGSAWSELCIWDPDGRLILVADPMNQLDDLTVADLFFESREPPNSEVAIADIRAAFPAGEYRVTGTDFEGTPRVATARFTHDIPAEPEILFPPLTDDPETAVEATVSPEGLIVTWEPVTETIDGGPVSVVSYEVIVTKDDHEDPDALSRPVYDVHIGPDATALSVPADFFEPDTIYELEILALEQSGNQTIGLGFFQTSPAPDPGETGEFADLHVFIEYNADGDDLGFHVEFDGDPWVGATLIAPDANTVFDLAGHGSLARQGLSSNFFESGEYPAEEVSREEFLARFPGGLYTLEGRSLDGEPLVSTATLSHLIPDPPEIITPGEDAVVDRGDVVVAWEPVASPAGVEIEVYQLQLFPVDPPEGTSPIELNVDLTFEVPGTVTEVPVPAELLAPGAAYEFELMAVDGGGNQTFTVGSFATSG